MVSCEEGSCRGGCTTTHFQTLRLGYTNFYTIRTSHLNFRIRSERGSSPRFSIKDVLFVRYVGCHFGGFSCTLSFAARGGTGVGELQFSKTLDFVVSGSTTVLWARPASTPLWTPFPGHSRSLISYVTCLPRVARCIQGTRLGQTLLLTIFHRPVHGSRRAPSLLGVLRF